MTQKAASSSTRPTAGPAPRAGPPHGVATVGLDPVGDADHDRHQAEREGDVAGQSMVETWLFRGTSFSL